MTIAVDLGRKATKQTNHKQRDVQPVQSYHYLCYLLNGYSMIFQNVLQDFNDFSINIFSII